MTTMFKINADGSLTSTARKPIEELDGRVAMDMQADLRRIVSSVRAAADGRVMTEQERRMLSNASSLAPRLGAAIERYELKQNEERALIAAMTDEHPDTAAVMRERQASGISGLVPASWPTAATATPGRRSYASVHGRRNADTGGWRDSTEIFRVLGAGLNDNRLQAAGQGGNDDRVGGYALPTATEMAIFDGAVPSSIFLPRANVQPMTTRSQDVATFDRSSDGANGTLFGLGFEFLPEGGGGADVQTANLRMIKMTAHTAAILFDCSNEQLQDANGFESGLLRAVQAAAGYGIDRYCLRGTGAGQPLGITNQPALITVTKESGQSADTIVYANLTKMFSRMPTSSIPSSVWLASPSCIPALSTLSVVVGTGGSHIPAMTSKDGSYELLTRPVIFTDLCRPVGDAGDLMLCDLSQFTIGLRAGMAVDRSNDVGFSKNRTTFRLLLRFDGNSGWDQPYQPEFSAPTQSPFIQLEAR